MNKEEILLRLKPIFQDIFDDETLEISCETSAKDIEDWDSFSQIRLIAAIEKDLNIEFAFGELNSLKDVGAMIDLIKFKQTN